MTPKTANWCRTCENFGDRLTVPLLALLAGVEATWAPPKAAEIIGVGSILSKLPSRGYRGTVLGTGMMYDRPGPDLRQARVLAVRGPLTAKACRVPEARLGDPGLLADLLTDEAEGAGEPLVVPHNVDKNLIGRYPGYRPVSLRGKPASVVRAVRGADRLVTSSLHGLILADALGLPRLYDPHPGVNGAGFKFRDYGASLGQEVVPGEWQTAPPARVAELRAGLLEAFQCVTSF